jgi:hypothetical protein
LDAINWQPGWIPLDKTDPAEFTRRVRAAAAGEAWISDGNYSKVHQTPIERATHLVWLDYARAVALRRVIGRSVIRPVR